MELTLSQTFIAAADHDAALTFYTEVLGLELRNDVQAQGLFWISVGPKSQPDVTIVIEPAVGDPNASEEDKKAAAELLSKGLLRGVIFGTDDVDATFERISAAGAEVLQEPTDQFYGVRDCAFRDPSGNMIRFSQPVKQG
ncbi:VOC family protein [Nocardia sp. NPDC050712]|uniref:VOC family protein n=1 Tax=Nocardia sp. NPDC050712 TaxID=3155518 RepID=UPI0033E9430A